MTAISYTEILFILLGLLATVFWIWALVDCAKHSSRRGQEWIVWLVVIALTHALGAVLYVLFYRPKIVR